VHARCHVGCKSRLVDYDDNSNNNGNGNANNNDGSGSNGNNNSGNGSGEQLDDSSSLTDGTVASEWVVVSDGKSYTPAATDVGCRLRIEVSAVSLVSADKSLLAGPIAVYTEPVLAAPVRPPKRGLQMIPGANSGIAGAMRFRVVSYNILAEQYATKQVSLSFSFFLSLFLSLCVCV
jgi:hypothetical protein